MLLNGKMSVNSTFYSVGQAILSDGDPFGMSQFMLLPNAYAVNAFRSVMVPDWKNSESQNRYQLAFLSLSGFLT